MALNSSLTCTLVPPLKISSDYKYGRYRDTIQK